MIPKMNTMLRMLIPLAAAALTLPAQSPEKLNSNFQTFRGTLVDAGCRDFSTYNLSRSPVSLAGSTPAQTPQAMAGAKSTNAKQPGAAPNGGADSSGPRTASGITVDAQTLAAERTDVMPHQVPDLMSRQSDPTCAVRANTRAYALLLPNGRLLDLDEGGNTFANVAVDGSSAGRAMLAGQAPGMKPQTVVKGRLMGDKIVATSVQLQ
jgi:hypothetical protein